MKPIIFVLMLFVISQAKGQTINLDKLTLNDTILSKLTVEKLTDMLGRPSAIKKPNQLIPNNYFGDDVYYHDKGLKFSFRPKHLDPKQRIRDIDLYLVKTWDKEHNEFFYPFSGKIIPDLNPNMKTTNILPLFNNYKVSVETAEEKRIRLEALYKEKGWMANWNPNDIKYDIIYVNNNGFIVGVFCEEVTKYLEKVNILWDSYK